MKLLIFAGTSEGKDGAAFLESQGNEVFVTVATEYGKEIFEKDLPKTIHLLEGRLSPKEMAKLMADKDLVIDATHPYAVEVSKNIVSACQEAHKPYLRILRSNQGSADFSQFMIKVKSQEEAIAFLNEHPGKVLLTTGSKDLKKYTQIKDYQERLYPRILPDMDSLKIAADNGYAKKNIICMQGPFTDEINVAMIQMIGASYLLTKETGGSGGYLEKLRACEIANIQGIVIERPREEVDKEQQAPLWKESLTLSELKGYFAQRSELDLAEIKKYKEFLTSRKGEMESTASGDTGDSKDWAAKITQQEMSEVTVPKKSFEAPRFPIFLDLKEELVTVIGSGNIARRRIKALLQYGARVKVISPHAKDNLQMAGIIDWETDVNPEYKGTLEAIDRFYEEDDLEGAVLAIAATNDRKVNHRIYLEAKRRGIFVSVADKKEESSYYFPALWTGESLSVGIVGDGEDHGYVKRSADAIRRALDEIEFGE